MVRCWLQLNCNLFFRFSDVKLTGLLRQMRRILLHTPNLDSIWLECSGTLNVVIDTLKKAFPTIIQRRTVMTPKDDGPSVIPR